MKRSVVEPSTQPLSYARGETTRHPTAACAEWDVDLSDESSSSHENAEPGLFSGSCRWFKEYVVYQALQRVGLDFL